MAAKPARKVTFSVAAGFKRKLARFVANEAKVKEAFDHFVDAKSEIPPRRLPGGMRDHKLQGKLADCRECHLAADVLLIYKHADEVVDLIDVCTHDDPYKKYS